MLKRIIKVAAIYILALGVGVALFFIARPYAKAHRENPNLIGGEVGLPIAVPMLTYMVRSIRNDIKAGLFSAEEADDE